MPPSTLPPYARSRTFTLTVGGSDGDASDRAVLMQSVDTRPNRAGKAIVTVVSAPADATLVSDKLRPNADGENTPVDFTDDANWRLAIDSSDATVGELAMQDFNFCPGVGYRAISGGSAGDVVIDVSWESLP